MRHVVNIWVWKKSSFLCRRFVDMLTCRRDGSVYWPPDWVGMTCKGFRMWSLSDVTCVRGCERSRDLGRWWWSDLTIKVVMTIHIHLFFVPINSMGCGFHTSFYFPIIFLVSESVLIEDLLKGNHFFLLLR